MTNVGRLRSRATATGTRAHSVAVAGGWSAAGAVGAIRSEHLVDQTFGSDVLNLRQDRGFFLFGVEPLANGVVDESHETGRDDNATRRVSDMND